MTRLSTIPTAIIPGWNPDPSIVRVGDDYFLATSTFEYFPGIPIYHSKDLVNWDIIGHALNRRSQLDLRRVDAGGGIYAPTLRYHKGRFYLATTCVYSRQGLLASRSGRTCLRESDTQLNETRGFYVSTDNVWDETAWSEPVYFDMVGIDQDLFFDDDDRVYLCVSRLMPFRPSPADPPPVAVILGCEVDLATGASLSRPVQLARSTTTSCAEGPHILKRDGWYWLLVAEGGTAEHHQVRMSRSKFPMGPYECPEDDGINPLLFNWLHPTVRNTGHADFVQDTKGHWWAYFLGTRPQSDGSAPLGRECMMTPMEWREGEWPTINQGKKVELSFESAVLPPQRFEPLWKDSFEQDVLAPGWYHVRTPIKADYSLPQRSSSLAIKGNAWSIRDVECPAMLLRKQITHDCTWSTVLDFEPSTRNEEAGITAYMSCFAYAALMVRKASSPSGRELALEWIDETKDEIEFKEIVHQITSAGPIELSIRATGTSYTFSYSNKGSATVIGCVPSAVLVHERSANSPYTGAMFGLFAQGREGFPCADWAYFQYAQLERHDSPAV